MIVNAGSYNVNSFGTITDPGKFEGETLATPWFYDIMLQAGEVDGLIEIDESEHKQFEIPADKHYVRVDESNDGFVSLRYFTEAEKEKWLESYDRVTDWNDEDYDYE